MLGSRSSGVLPTSSHASIGERARCRNASVLPVLAFESMLGFENSIAICSTQTSGLRACNSALKGLLVDPSCSRKSVRLELSIQRAWRDAENLRSLALMPTRLFEHCEYLLAAHLVKA